MANVDKGRLSERELARPAKGVAAAILRPQLLPRCLTRKRNPRLCGFLWWAVLGSNQ